VKDSTLYVVEGGASHFVNSCAAMERCVRCAKSLKGDDVAYIAQVTARKAPKPTTLCGGVLCSRCAGAFLTWMSAAR
jgi:hypothetical protein